MYDRIQSSKNMQFLRILTFLIMQNEKSPSESVTYKRRQFQSELF